jgi:hypothetical protein
MVGAASVGRGKERNDGYLSHALSIVVCVYFARKLR